MYQALYRKWRPRVFEDVVGLPHVTQTLRNEIMNGRVAHAYLFTGSRGTGKTTCARILAKAVNCENPQHGDPCGECASCRRIEDGASLDITEIDAASNNGVDSIRDLREETNFTPAELKYRVYIIDEVHMLTTQAFNALLKTLEEPPAHVIFVLATTEVNKLPATILSRCQRFDFHRIPMEAIRDRVQYIAREEAIPLTQEAAELIARVSDGGMRDALSLLDQCAATQGEITAEVAAGVAGLASKEYLLALSRHILAHETQQAVALVDELYAQSCDMDQLTSELIAHYRDLMLLKISKNAASELKAEAKTIEAMQQIAQAYTLPAVIAVLERLQLTSERMRFSSDRLIDLELCMVRLCEPALDESSAALLSRVAALEKAVAAGFTPAPAPQPTDGAPTLSSASRAPAVPPAPAAQPASASPRAVKEASRQAASPAARPVREWPEILAALRAKNPAVAGFLQTAKASLQGDSIVLAEVNAFLADRIRAGASDVKRPLEEAIAEVLGQRYAVRLEDASAGAAQPAPAGADPLEEALRRAREAGIPVREE